MKECDNSKIHISSNFILSICLLIMFDTLLLRPSLHYQHSCNAALMMEARAKEARGFPYVKTCLYQCAFNILHTRPLNWHFNSILCAFLCSLPCLHNRLQRFPYPEADESSLQIPTTFLLRFTLSLWCGVKWSGRKFKWGEAKWEVSEV